MAEWMLTLITGASSRSRAWQWRFATVALILTAITASVTSGGTSRAMVASTASTHADRMPTAVMHHGIYSTTPTTGLVSAQQMQYHGGANGAPIIAQPEQVYLVFWGTWGTASQGANITGTQQPLITFTGDLISAEAPALEQFFAGLGTSDDTWSGVLTQYCASTDAAPMLVGATTCPNGAPHVGYPTGGALAGVWYDTQNTEPQTAQLREIANEAQLAAAHFGNTTAASNRNAIYVVVSPPYFHPEDFNTTTTNTAGFCADHDITSDPNIPGNPSNANGPVAFIDFPYLSDLAVGALCGKNAVLTGTPGGTATSGWQTIVASHEYAEVATDTSPYASGGWWDAHGKETGDDCAWLTSGPGAMTNITLATGTFAVQSIWSNQDNGCTTTDPVIRSVAFSLAAGDQMSTFGTPIAPLSFTAIDNSSYAGLEYSATGLSPGLSIDPVSGVITGTPTAPAAPHTVTVSARNASGPAGSTSFTWTVVQPTYTTISLRASTWATTQSVRVTTVVRSRIGSEIPTGVVEFVDARSRIGRCTLTRGTCATTVKFTTPGIHALRAVYRGKGDAQASSSPARTETIVNAIHVRAPRATIFTIGARISVTVSATDIIPGRRLIFAAAGLPHGLVIDPTTGHISGSLWRQSSPAVIRIHVRDSGGARAAWNLNWQAR